MLLQIKETTYDPTEQSFGVQLIFDGHTQFEAKITLPSKHKEELWEWYFESYHSETTSKLSIEKANTTVHAISDYGEDLFLELFRDRKAYVKYTETRNDLASLVIEIEGKSAEFHAIHWETLYDPDLPLPLFQYAVVFRHINRNYSPINSARKPSPFIHLLVVSSRPNEEDDVNYLTIQKPLVEAIEKSGARVKVEVLRPATFQSLLRHLQEKGATYYNIIHFDLHGNVLTYNDFKRLHKKGQAQEIGKSGLHYQVTWGLSNINKYEGKQAFLYFETEEKGKAALISAKELAAQLQQYRIPIYLFNACQSAKPPLGEQKSLGRIISEQNGPNVVLAMRYNMTITAASIFMESFYKQLARTYSVDQAITLARMELFLNKNRSNAQNQNYALEDWLLPIVYSKNKYFEQNQFELIEFPTPAAEEAYYTVKASFARPPRKFEGRDLDLLKIEKQLALHKNHLLVNGAASIGKTTLLKYLAWWWPVTNWVKQSFYFACKEKLYTTESIIDNVIDQLIDEPTTKSIKESKKSIRQFKLIEWLQRNPYAILIDDIDHCFQQMDTSGQEELIDFLQRINNTTKLVYTYTEPNKIKNLQEAVGGEQSYVLKDHTLIPEIPIVQNTLPNVGVEEPKLGGEVTQPDDKSENKVPVNLYIAFDNKDVKYVQKLEKFFDRLSNKLVVEIWHHKKIKAGEVRSKKINEALGQADIILYLISSDFLASNYYNEIAPKVWNRYQQELSQLIPIILRPALWEYEDFADIESLPDDGKAVTRAENEDLVFKDIVLVIASKIKNFEKPTNQTLKAAVQNQTSKPITMDKEAIRALIVKGRIIEAIEALKAHVDTEGLIELGTLETDFTELKRDHRINTISRSEYNTQRNKIVYSLLKMIGEI